MNRIWITALAVELLFLVSLGCGATPEDIAAAKIRKLTMLVERDGDLPGNPVVGVDLSCC